MSPMKISEFFFIVILFFILALIPIMLKAADENEEDVRYKSLGKGVAFSSSSKKEMERSIYHSS